MVLHFTQHQIVLWTSLFNTETAFKSSFRNYFSLDTLSNIVLARRYTVVFWRLFPVSLGVSVPSSSPVRANLLRRLFAELALKALSCLSRYNMWNEVCKQQMLLLFKMYCHSCRVFCPIYA